VTKKKSKKKIGIQSATAKTISNKRKLKNTKFQNEIVVANQHFQANRLSQAEQICRQILKVDPEHYNACYIMGRLCQQASRHKLAVRYFQNTIKSMPQHYVAHWRLAGSYNSMEQLEQAISSFQTALALNSSDPRLHCHLGQTLRNAGHLEDAISVYQKALQQHPGYAEILFELAKALRDNGDKEQAKVNYRLAIKAKPDYGDAYYQLSTIDKHRVYDDDIQILIDGYNQSNIADHERKLVAYGLGKAYEDLQDYDLAFKYFSEANQLHRATYRYSIADEGVRFNRLKKEYDKAFIEHFTDAGVDDNRPIFIIGMPRSGSTLLEQILASHANIGTAGELVYLTGLAKDLQTLTHKPYPEGIKQLDPKHINQLGRDYIEKLRGHGTNLPHTIDKLPHNFLYVGLIKAALPNAKIIDCRREPMGTCLSIFGTYLPSSHHYAFSMQEIGEYYRLYDNLMTHWHNIFPETIYTLRYEALVSNPETEIRRLLDYCQLPFDKNCLSHHTRTLGTVNTASHSQVRQPIHKNSIQRWLNYGDHLQPLKTALGVS